MEARDAATRSRRRRREGSDGCVRRRRDRGGLGGRGARGPVVGGSGHVGAVARGRPRPRLGRHARGGARRQLLRRGVRAGPHLDGAGRDARAGSGRNVVRARPRRGRVVVGERDGRASAARSTTTSAGPGSSAARVGVGPRCSPRSCASRTTPTTAATACTARAGRSRCSRLPFDALPPLDLALRAAMTDLGYPACDDYHAPDATGVSRMALTMRDGKRVSTNDAYLEPARARPNLEVRGDVLVDRVLFDGSRADRRADRDGRGDRRGRGVRERGRDPLARDPPAVGCRRRRRPAGRPEPEGARGHARFRDRVEARRADGRRPTRRCSARCSATRRSWPTRARTTCR